jgi:PAS domain S-box-containing protein
MQWEILERIAEGAALRELLASIAGWVEQHDESTSCCILELDPQTGYLTPGAGQRLPAQLRKQLEGLAISPRAGSCGAAALRGEPVIVTDIDTHESWSASKAPFLAHGIRACWSSPIFSPQHVLLGTLALYCHEKRGPSHAEAARIARATQLSAMALARARSEHEHQRLLHDMSERVKEVTLLQRSARLLTQHQRQPRELLAELVQLLPSGWRYSEVCEARIQWGDLQLATPGYPDAPPYRQSASARAGTHDVRLEVAYTAARPSSAEGPFLAEERHMLQSLADLCGTYLDRHSADQALQGTLFALRDAHQRLEFQVSHMPLAYIVWDEHCRVTSWNRAAELIFGWTREEALGLYGKDLMIAPSQSPSPSLEPPAPDEGNATRSLHENVHKDGHRLVCEWHHVPLRNQAGQVTGHLSMANDVTDRKRADEERAALEGQLRQAQRIQSLGTLTGGIAHDFNNLLTAITGHTQLGLNDIEEERSTKDSLLAIQEASLRAVELVRHILTFSRNREPDRTLTLLTPIVEEALSVLRLDLAPAIEIQAHFHPRSPAVYVDVSQIKQLVMNLGSNAGHALDQRGRITVRVEPVSADHEDLLGIADPRFTGYVRLSVSDDGSGIDSATLERIFEPFFTTRPAGHGTGLGLSVVHGIVKAHEGVISVESRPGQGSTFRVYFPEAVAQPGSPRSVPPKEPQRTGGMRVLYVDDEEPLVVLASRWLGRLGHQVTGHSDAVRALAAFREHPDDFDAVISDFSMPELSGLDLVREILSIRPGMIVVMSSGYVRPEDQQAAKALGAVDVVSKPQSMAEFGRILDRLLAEQSTLAGVTRS